MFWERTSLQNHEAKSHLLEMQINDHEFQIQGDAACLNLPLSALVRMNSASYLTIADTGTNIKADNYNLFYEKANIPVPLLLTSQSVRKVSI
jgi:hypothetical protein